MPRAGRDEGALDPAAEVDERQLGLLEEGERLFAAREQVGAGATRRGGRTRRVDDALDDVGRPARRCP